jgi:hypothetical protein
MKEIFTGKKKKLGDVYITDKKETRERAISTAATFRSRKLRMVAVPGFTPLTWINIKPGEDEAEKIERFKAQKNFILIK